MMTTDSDETMIAAATIADLDDLIDIENRCFQIDRMSKRSMKHMLQKANCDFILARQRAKTVAYLLVLYHRGTHLARVYSLAVLPEQRGKKIGELLLQHAEQLAVARDCIYMRLEVHQENTGAIHLYEKNGYHPFGMFKDYYEDHGDALRFQKRILYRKDQRDFVAIPYYLQTTEFTCGPAALMMAMQALNKDIKLDRTLELQLWREATTIYMTSGHGGCGPLGLALAAWQRGFKVEIYINTQEPLFIDGVRGEQKKSVLELVHHDFINQIKQTDIAIHYQTITLDKIDSKMKQGGIPLVLISRYPFLRTKAPHWVVVSGSDKTFIYVHDPDDDEETYRAAMDNIYLPIARPTFDKAFRFGRTGLRSCVILYGH
jgi:ribosomal protein S18 acetylase RimI-like enzyme